MARRKAKSPKDQDIAFLTSVLNEQTAALKEGPKRKKFTEHDLKHIKPLTEGQRMMFESYFSGNTIIANGSAGTGKTFCSLYLALRDIFDKESQQKEIIIVRSSSSVKNQGFLPGSLSEKMAPFEDPYKDVCASLLGKSEAYETLKESGMLRFMSTSFVRGLTWDNAVILIDEAQGLNFHEMNSVITRIGKNSKLLICGDTKQDDLIYNKNDVSGYPRALRAFEKMKEVDIINFTRDDIVRSKFVKSWICAVEDTE